LAVVNEYPKPVLGSLDPPSVKVGGPAFTLTLNGSNFVSESKVRWGGSDRTTTFVSSSQLKASIAAADIAADGIVAVTVFTPAPGGGTSNAISMEVEAEKVWLPLIIKK
jgi:hypothetical protein